MAPFFCLSYSPCDRSYFLVGYYGSKSSNTYDLTPLSSLKCMTSCLRVAALLRSNSLKQTPYGPFPLASALQITYHCKITCVFLNLPVTTDIKSMTLLRRRLRRQGQVIAHRGASLPAVTEVISGDHRRPYF